MQIQLPWKFCQGNFFNLSGFSASIAISVFAAKADGSEFMPDYEQVSNTITTLKRTCKVGLKKSLPLFILQRRSRVLIFDRRQYHRCIDSIILIDMIMYMFSHTVNNISMKLVSRTKFEVTNTGRVFFNAFGEPYDSLNNSASFKVNHSLFQNYLSWSFGLAFVAAFFDFVGGILFLVESRIMKRKDIAREKQYPMERRL